MTTNHFESEIESEYSQERMTRSVDLKNVDSMINKFSPCYTPDTKDIGKAIITQVVDKVLHIEGGDFLGSSTECSTIRAESGHSRDIGQRITYWQEYLKEHAIISEKLARATGKDKTELLLNRTEDFRKSQQCKTIMDVAERLSPTRLAVRQPITTKNIPCVPDIHETLPLQERLQKPLFTLTGMPNIALQEQGIDQVFSKNARWHKSKYLGEKLERNKYEIKQILKHWPEIEPLQVIGAKVLPAEPKKAEDDVFKSKQVDFRLSCAWYTCKEPTLQHVIKVEDKEFDAEQKCNTNVKFCFAFECKPFEQKTRKLTIRNKGWKAIDVGWTRIREKKLRCLPHEGEIYPAFYFNKNLSRIHPGATTDIEFVFCCKEFGIYEECWEMKLMPKFLAEKRKMTVSLFGKCDVDSQDKEELQQIDQSFKERAAKQIATEVIYDVATCARPEPPLHIPYYQQIKESELFNIVNPNLNYNEDCIDKLKNMYTEIAQNDASKICKTWNFDLKEMRNIILNISDDLQRKESFIMFNRLIAEMKMNATVFGPNYEDQKILLVKNVLLGLADGMERTVSVLESSILSSQYDLHFDEVLVTGSKFRPKNTVDPKDSSEDSGLDDDAKSACVIKSECIRKKKQEAFQESLYIHTYGQLCTASEHIVSILEGLKNF